MKKILLFIFAFFIMSGYVWAESNCSYTEQAELLNKAANVKANYEVKEEIVHFVDTDSSRDYFLITIYNITEEFYVIIKNDFNSEAKMISYADTKDGVATYKWYNIENVTNFTIEVHSSTKTKCAAEKFKTLYLQTPRYNEYYDREVCEEMTDFYLCQKYITSTAVTEERFFEQLKNYQSGKIDDEGKEIENKNIFTKVLNFVEKNKWYVLGGVVIVAGGAIYIYSRKKKSREL